MGFIANLISFARKGLISQAKVDPGGTYTQEAVHFDSPGDDSYPLPGDKVALIRTERSGVLDAVGYIDPKNKQKAKPGGKRIYSRDAAGNQVAEIWLMNDGTISGSNANGSFTLDVAGDFVINGVIIDTDGNIITTGKITAPEIEAENSLIINNGELNGHTHISANPGSPSGPFPP